MALTKNKASAKKRVEPTPQTDSESFTENVSTLMGNSVALLELEKLAGRLDPEELRRVYYSLLSIRDRSALVYLLSLSEEQFADLSQDLREQRNATQELRKKLLPLRAHLMTIEERS
jgi:hypothetical protein